MEEKNIDQLKGNEDNPRTISEFDFKNLKKAIVEFGDLSGIVFNVRTGQLVGGHQRIEAFKQLGGKPIIDRRLDEPSKVGTVATGYVLLDGEQYAYREVDWELAREQAANIAANRITGQFDQDLLAKVTFEISQANPDLLELTGQTDKEITKLLDSVTAVFGTLDEEDEAPEVETGETELVSKLGEIYQLGPHRLMCGDSTSRADVERLMAGEKADMVFTDPPYNVDYEGGTGLKIQNDKFDSSDAFYAFLLGAFKNMAIAMKTGGGIYVCHADLEGINFRRAFTDAGFKLASVLIWNKNSLVLGRGDYQWKHEPILYGWMEGSAHYFTDRRDLTTVWDEAKPFETQFDGEYTYITVGDHEIRIQGAIEGRVRAVKEQNTVWDFDKPNRNEDHPTMKPLALCEKAIRNSSLQGEKVLDLFGGSGSTLIAADRLNRVGYTIELDPRYVDAIRKRYAKHTGAVDWQAATPAIENLQGVIAQPEPVLAQGGIVNSDGPILVGEGPGAPSYVLPPAPLADGYTPPIIPHE